MKTKLKNSLKILCIGDMHGYVPRKAKKIVEWEKPDIIISTGDFCNADKSRKLIFKHWDELAYVNLADIVGEKILKKIYSEEIKSSYAPIKFLKSLNVPIYTITGNNDFVRKDMNWLKKDLKLNEKSFEDLIAGSNIKLLNRKRINGFLLLGKSGYFGFGDYDIRKRESDLKKLFESPMNKKSKSKKIILVTHSPPYGTLDVVNWKKSPMHGKHVGDKAYRRAINRYQPMLNICSHMHENQGIKKLRKTTVLNLGLAKEGLFIVEIGDKMKIRKV